MLNSIRSIFLRFVLLSYGKVYTSLLKSETSSDSVRFSAVIQFSLLLTLNFIALLFFVVHFTYDVMGLEELVDSERSNILKTVVITVGCVIIYCVYSISRLYDGEYEKALSKNKYVEFYPYFVAVLLVLSIGLYSAG